MLNIFFYYYFRSSTKEEKQRHNEEIVINKSTSSCETGPVPTILELKENCKLFISSERNYCSSGMEVPINTTVKYY